MLGVVEVWTAELEAGIGTDEPEVECVVEVGSIDPDFTLEFRAGIVFAEVEVGAGRISLVGTEN